MLKTIGTADINTSTALSNQYRLTDKFRVLFELHHVRQFHSRFLKVNVKLLMCNIHLHNTGDGGQALHEEMIDIDEQVSHVHMQTSESCTNNKWVMII